MKNLFTFFLLFFSYLVFACECEKKPALDIKDWNDTDVIFSAVLSQYSQTLKFKKLTFSISRMYKGKVQKKEIQFYISNFTNHLALHHVDSIAVGQKWLVFATKSKRNNTEYLTLLEGDTEGYCMLTRPVQENDNYSAFIKQIRKRPFVKDHTFLTERTIVARGSLENLIPVGSWKYFNSLNDFWEGQYLKGKRNGKWFHKAVNFKKEKVIVGYKQYDHGVLKERIQNNYLGQKQIHEVFGDTLKTRTFYNGRFITQVWTVNTLKKTTLVERYKNGKRIDFIKHERALF